MANPLEQFEVKPIIPLHFHGYDISFTNSSLFMVLAVVSIVTLFGFCLRKRTVIPSLSQSFPEAIYDFIHGLMQDTVGKEGFHTLHELLWFSCLHIMNKLIYYEWRVGSC